MQLQALWAWSTRSQTWRQLGLESQTLQNAPQKQVHHALLQHLRTLNQGLMVAVAVGVAGVFIEVHDDPDNAASDGPNNLHIEDLEKLLAKLQAIDTISKSV